MTLWVWKSRNSWIGINLLEQKRPFQRGSKYDRHYEQKAKWEVGSHGTKNVPYCKENQHSWIRQPTKWEKKYSLSVVQLKDEM